METKAGGAGQLETCLPVVGRGRPGREAALSLPWRWRDVSKLVGELAEACGRLVSHVGVHWDTEAQRTESRRVEGQRVAQVLASATPTPFYFTS